MRQTTSTPYVNYSYPTASSQEKEVFMAEEIKFEVGNEKAILERIKDIERC